MWRLAKEQDAGQLPSEPPSAKQVTLGPWSARICRIESKSQSPRVCFKRAKELQKSKNRSWTIAPFRLPVAA
eukprot:Skav213880  [mRNA]  locus=scaffold2374:180322:180537:- [translate_table: standard]